MNACPSGLSNICGLITASEIMKRFYRAMCHVKGQCRPRIYELGYTERRLLLRAGGDTGGRHRSGKGRPVRRDSRSAPPYHAFLPHPEPGHFLHMVAAARHGAYAEAQLAASALQLPHRGRGPGAFPISKARQNRLTVALSDVRTGAVVNGTDEATCTSTRRTIPITRCIPAQVKPPKPG